MYHPSVDEIPALARIRALLLGTLAFGVVGMTTELLLLGHVDSVSQWTPVVLLGASVLLLIWHAAAPSRVTVRAVQVTMILFIVTGGIGVGLHYDGNVEFELELSPEASGFDLMAKTMTGATPVLAPGTMAVLGLVGLAGVHRHPATQGVR
jgi:hypothetical protein